MCIRDSVNKLLGAKGSRTVDSFHRELGRLLWDACGMSRTCLLYTSDAADERSSVDLGGRRIIKKKRKSNDVGNKTIAKST